ncbi:hypothetical protein BDZ45DRAFT_488215 [Acephala macrosclerotiorum]|nr:hypothetical protein BDZ45DRAFT_488215 [Acephala macrosclerotiorum]
MLFEHYSCKTADQICGVAESANPFLTHILPLAYVDSLVLHSILALSGAHLIHKASNSNLRAATWTHYGLAVRGLKEALTKVDICPLDGTAVAQMLATTLLLCHVEAVSGNIHGAIFHHLRASRHFALALLKKPKAQLDEHFRIFLLELYAYLALVGNITTSLGSLDRTIPLDSFLSYLEGLDDEKTSGSMLSCAHGLFQLIPQIRQLGLLCQEEDRIILSSGSSAFQYASLEAKLEHWEPSPDRYRNSEFPAQLLAAGRIYQYAILTFLHTKYYGSDVNNPILLQKVDALILKLFQLMKECRWAQPGHPKIPAIATTLLWPYVIMGSCMRYLEHQDHIRSMLQRSPFEMTIVQRVLQLLEWLWADSSPYAYGPYGLEITMKKHNMNICMA